MGNKYLYIHLSTNLHIINKPFKIGLKKKHLQNAENIPNLLFKSYIQTVKVIYCTLYKN